jgi:hypothetical protein
MFRTPNQSERKFSQKHYFLCLESENYPKISRGYPTEFVGSTQNPKKKIKSTNQNENLAKTKYVWYLQSENEPTICMKGVGHRIITKCLRHQINHKLIFSTRTFFRNEKFE